MKLDLSHKYYISIIFIISLYVMPTVIWHTKSENNLSVAIINKTVPDNTYREHKGIHWLLNHFKIKNTLTGNYFNESIDYYGFHPKDIDFEVKNFENIDYQPDIIYLADSTGVLKGEYKNLLDSDKYPTILSGGITKNEIYNIKSRLKYGTTLIGEFNILRSPTSEEVSYELEKLFNVKNSKILGRYFLELDKNVEVPSWIIERYESQNKNRWEFVGAGVVIITANEKIVVLEEGKDITEEFITFEFTDRYKEIYNFKKSISYYYWFEIIESNTNNEIVATFKINSTTTGTDILESNGIPKLFPAIVYKDNKDYKSFYFSGDFVDINNLPSNYKRYGTDLIKKTIALDKEGGVEHFFWKCYTPVVKKILTDALKSKASDVVEKSNIFQVEKVKLISKIDNNKFMIYGNNQWEEFFFKGINMGMATPGFWFTQMPRDEYVYYEWFDMIAGMNINSIRVYTLCPPEFYKALYYFNKKNIDRKLYLIQEIWPDENPKDKNYLLEENVDVFIKDIENVIDAIHGNANIKMRLGKSYGIYDRDVSEYTIAYLVGRELEPDEVIATNELNKGYKFKGEYISNNSNSPTESWLAYSCDYVLGYENNKYNWQRPVSIVSWPTLDWIEHDSEWNESGDKNLEYNDKVSIDINNFNVESKNIVGFFGSYHIYPNYPDFMNNEQRENPYEDEQGEFLYGGYLKEFMSVHKKYPALVAEFGIATGMGNAHSNPNGYNHGGLTEEEQGIGIVRMMEAIREEGYMGGIIFEWMDEWAKKTWTTEPYMIPYERKVLWHNMIDPEQNYGIMANEAVIPEIPFAKFSDNEYIKKLELFANEEYLFLNFTMDDLDYIISNKKIIIGLDTYNEHKGQSKFSEDLAIDAPTGLEYVIEIEGKDANILVTPDYNISNYKYASKKRDDGVFEKILPLINKSRVRKDGTLIEQINFNASYLKFGNFNISNSQWYYNENTLRFRIPWNLLNFVDPSQLRVLDDEKFNTISQRDEFETKITEGIVVSAVVIDKEKNIMDIFPGKESFNVERVKWSQWDKPKYKERLKDSYDIVREYFQD